MSQEKIPQGLITDAFTGEDFQARSRNHYEVPDPKPVAPPVDLPRPTVRQRVENLINRGVDPLAQYVGADDYDMEVPDDPDAPLTESEALLLDMEAARLAEQAPLPDEGLPRPPEAAQGGASPPASSAAPSSGAPPAAAQAAGEGVKPSAG